MTDDDYMTFGKYGPDKGDRRRMKDIPAQYLLWLWDNVLHNSQSASHKEVKWYVEDAYKALLIDCPDYLPINPPKS